MKKLYEIYRYVINTNDALRKKFSRLVVFSVIGGLLEMITLYIFFTALGNDRFSIVVNINEVNSYIVFSILLALIMLTYFLRYYVLSLSTCLGFDLGLNYNKSNFENFLMNDYLKIKRHSEAKFLSSVNFKTDNLIFNIFIPISKIISNAIIAIILSFFIVWIIGIIGFIVMTSIIVFYYFIIRSSSQILIKNGEKIDKSSNKIMNTVKDIFGQMRYILIDKDYRLLDSFIKEDSMVRYAQAQNLIIGNVPRILIEGLFFLVFSFFIVASSNPQDYFEIILIASIALMRLLPIYQALYANYASINSAFPIFEKNLITGVRQEAHNENYNFSKEKFKLKINKLEFRYPNSRVAITLTNLSIKSGDKILLEGASGKGKSTIFDIFSSLIEPDKIDMTLNDEKISNFSFWNSEVEYIDQKLYLPEKTLMEIFDIGGDIEYEFFINSIELIGLDFLHNHMNDILGVDFILSGGEMQRIRLLKAIFSKKNVLMLDEITSAVDFETSNLIVDYLMNLDKTIIFITHDENLKSKFDKKIIV
jgi:ATP-binding cassette, subfamily B, bacterial PglK